MPHFLIAALLCVVTMTATAQSAALEKIDRFVRAEMGRNKIPGVALAVIHKGKVVVAKGYGYANLEHGVPVRPDTIFQSGSVGKQFTATAVMTLVEQGKLGLDDPLTKYFPKAPEAWHFITVRHLLTHTSGIPAYDDFENSTTGIDLRRDYTEEDWARFAFELKPDFAPGVRWNYSDTGYVLLGIIIRKASGQFYGDLLQDRVFKPLGMNTARVISEEDIVPHRAAGYRLSNEKLKNQEWVSPTLNTTADGALYLSLRDLIAWAKGLRDGRILSAKSWQLMYSPETLKSGSQYPYGFGWFVESFNGQSRLQHDGKWQGFGAYISRDLGPDITVIVLANAAHADVRRLGVGVAGSYLPALAPRPEIPIADEPDVRKRLDSLIEQAREGLLSALDLAYVQKGFFPGVAAEYKSRLASLGRAQQVSLLERSVKGDDRLYRYELQYEKETLTVTLGLAPDGKVSTFALGPKQPPLGI